ncbi:DNA-binding protein HU-beta [Neisseria sp. HSC-16F19]|nr:HU family DNA-binding protein [Neisseria sp. HSC-16F19]MCP2041449.1 DNA-binding protein HU-beta [Neisseria sp. HSC-16F19]
MNKTELIEKMAAWPGLDKKQAKTALDALEAVVTDALAKGEDVALVGFGTFSVAERAERQGRNPATGESITIAAGRTVKFKAGKTLKDAVR